MLLKRDTLEGIRTGTVTLAFRRWKRPTVKSGGTLRTSIGLLAILEVREVPWEEVLEKDARAAGHASKHALAEALEGREGTLYRIRLDLGGDDPRTALRQRKPGASEVEELRKRLAKSDALAPEGAWTERILRTIAQRPAVRAGDLAPELGYAKPLFKRRVRRLKELGLTISLPIGYELSPRGAALVEALGL